MHINSLFFNLNLQAFFSYSLQETCLILSSLDLLCPRSEKWILSYREEKSSTFNTLGILKLFWTFALELCGTWNLCVKAVQNYPVRRSQYFVSNNVLRRDVMNTAISIEPGYSLKILWPQALNSRERNNRIFFYRV